MSDPSPGARPGQLGGAPPVLPMAPSTTIDRSGSDVRAAADGPPPPGTLLDVRGLRKEYAMSRGLFLRRRVGTTRAVAGLSFAIRPGETLGLVGESGCGKSTVARCVARMIVPTAGQIWLRGGSQATGEPIDLARADGGTLRGLRRTMQMVFQDPFASLDPRMTVSRIIAEPLAVHGVGSRQDRRDRVRELLEIVGLGREHADRFPHEFSGGQRQRIGIARALALNPSLLILDEPVSSLDVSIQAQILNLLEDLQDRLELSYLFIAHDLSVVRHVSDRIAVMYLGRIVEMADRNTLYREPLHPYTHALLAAIPVPDPRIERSRARATLGGELPSAAEPPSGCSFHTRCPIAQLPEPCAVDEPPLTEVAPGHWVACHFPGPPRRAD